MNERSWHVSVLIPARNEEQLLPRCLRSVLAALAALPHATTAEIVVLVDSSTDRSRQIAIDLLGTRGTVLSAAAGAAGSARALAANNALTRNQAPLRRFWLANTDADCEVPLTWLTDQLRLADQGAEAIAGTVSVDSFAEHEPEVIHRFRSSYLIHADGSHPHVHGANFGVRADAYRVAGGWADLKTGEDHDLWNRLLRRGRPVVSTARIEVITSGRRIGRAPDGFAGALAAHNLTTA